MRMLHGPDILMKYNRKRANDKENKRDEEIDKKNEGRERERESESMRGE